MFEFQLVSLQAWNYVLPQYSLLIQYINLLFKNKSRLKTVQERRYDSASFFERLLTAIIFVFSLFMCSTLAIEEHESNRRCKLRLFYIFGYAAKTTRLANPCSQTKFFFSILGDTLYFGRSAGQ